eukprot:TRINITY_DN4976_c0_g1_i2.p1 TRINITY_DN4976_c0_g1~~TRINITY_DN4976_c0_g1_i2.p1  ORF type:complete len:401 (-),score=86.78 TRINITY_DN4976_c0_g1_i2:20-1222(-)
MSGSMKRRSNVSRHARIEKAQSMKVVIPMKDGLAPQEMTAQFRNHVYEEFASRYLEAIHVEPTKANVARMRAFVPAQHIALVPKFKVNGCIRDELAIDNINQLDKLPGFTNISGDADLFRKVFNTRSCALDSAAAPLPDIQPAAPEPRADKLPTIAVEVQNRCDISQAWYPTKQQISRSLSDFSALNPMSEVRRSLREEQRREIHDMLHSQHMVELVQTVCHYVHQHIFLMPHLKAPQALSSTGDTKVTPPLSPRTFDATVWRLNESFALLLAPYKRQKPMLSVVSVMVCFTARQVAKRLLVGEFAQWSRSLDGQAFLPSVDVLAMARLDPQKYMGGIDLFGDGRTCTERRVAVGDKHSVKGHPKRKWMRHMNKLSPLMSTLAGTLPNGGGKGHGNKGHG